MPIIFSLSLFLGASLLFMIQPMVAKSLLPIHGGTPAVWSVCMLFFQALLLIGYGYAWLLSQFKSNWCWRAIHAMVVIISLCMMPLTFVPTQDLLSPDKAILHDLLWQLSLPLLIVASSAPLLQFVYSRSAAKNAQDPYFLYVSSNIGSLLALLSYPWLVEQWTGLILQFKWWSYFFSGYLALVLLLIFMFPLKNKALIIVDGARITFSKMLYWVACSFIPCSLMLGVTFYITTDIAATPLFWVIPLALYLVTFIITFAKKPLISFGWLERNSLYFLFFPAFGFILGPNFLSVGQLTCFHLLYFFIFSLLCHSRLVQSRPAATQLTSFYVCLALGGALAGIFNGFIAPHILNGAYEYPLIIVLSGLCIPLKRRLPINGIIALIVTFLTINYCLPDTSWMGQLKKSHFLEIMCLIALLRWPKSSLNVVSGMAILFAFVLSPWFKNTPVLTQQRNFYGVKQVVEKNNMHALISQNIVHGFQLQDKENKTRGTIAYYGPPAQVVKHLQTIYPLLHVSIVGLGTGLMACQFRKDDQVQMVDIDEQVIAIAKDTHFFTYLRDCPPAVIVQQEDGRLALKKKKEASLELIIIDAFSSDAVPMHLLTKEAFTLYKEKLREGGTLLLNTSNRHVQLLPLVAAMGQALDLIVLDIAHPGNMNKGQLPSEWVALTANESLAQNLMRKGWHFSTLQSTPLWTDDYSNLIPLLRM